MRNLQLILATFFITVPALSFAQQSKPLKIAFTAEENDLIPEGIAYDGMNKDFFVSSTYKRKIIKFDSKGNVSDFTTEAQDGLSGVIGMRADEKRRLLWVASSNAGNGMPVKNLTAEEDGVSGVFKYSLTSGKLVKKYVLRENGKKFFLNDLVIDGRGNVFITDTMQGGIYTIDSRTDSLQLYYQLPVNHWPNGLDISEDGKWLFIAVYAQPENQIFRIRLEDKQVERVDMQRHKTGADGLYYFNKTLIAVVPGSADGKVVQYFLADDLQKVERVKILLHDDPLLSQPSTGVIAGKKFYFVASTNLQLFARLYNETKGQVDLKELAPVRIGVIDLE
jgi:sugar lactone lactonase YvrE